MIRTNAVYQGKQRIVILKYSYVLILVFWIIYKKEYFVRKEFPTTQNLYDESDLEQITKQQAYEYTFGDMPRVNWYRTYMAVFVLLVVISAAYWGNIINSSYKNPTPQLATEIVNNKDKNDLNTINSLLDNKGIKFVKPVMSLTDIKKSLQGQKSISFDNIAYIYPQTNKVTFEEFLNGMLLKDKDSKMLIKAKEIPEFMDNYPSALKDFEEQSENIKKYFFNNTKDSPEDQRLNFINFMLAVNRTKERGVRQGSIYSFKSKDGRVFELHLNPKDENKIFYFSMKVDNETNSNGLPL